MATRFVIVRRAGRHAIVRVLPSGDAAGYDAVSDREQQQVHFQIHRDSPHATAIDKAFRDSRQYRSLDDAVAAADSVGREVEVLA